MSGLPASGKSRLGAAIAPLLGLPLLDKDDFLEALYERDGIGDAAWRERLSRRSDDLFRAEAMAVTLATGGAVLTSFWRHPGRTDGGGQYHPNGGDSHHRALASMWEQNKYQGHAHRGDNAGGGAL